MILIVTTLILHGCAKSSIIQTLKNENLKLQKSGAPIRLIYTELKRGGVVFKRALLGQVHLSIAGNILKQDTLLAILKHGRFKEVSLFQTRAVKRDFRSNLVQEVWVIKNNRNHKYAYLVTYAFPKEGGTDIYLSAGYRI